MKWLESATIFEGHALSVLRSLPPSNDVRCCVTSPPYWGLRKYPVGEVTFDDGWAGQLGWEPTPELYVEHLVQVMREVRRVLANDGTLWLIIGDCYATQSGGSDGEHRGLARHREGGRTMAKDVGDLKRKDLVGIPWMVAFALRADGWYLRSDIIWSKRNPMPESVKDRPTSSHEHVFLLSKQPDYYFDRKAIAEPATSKPQRRLTTGGYSPEGAKVRMVRAMRTDPGVYGSEGDGLRNRRDVWRMVSTPYPGAHFAVMPLELARLCVLAGSASGDVVLDPFAGAGTTAVAAIQNGRTFLGVELCPEYRALALERIDKEASQQPLFDTSGGVV